MYKHNETTVLQHIVAHDPMKVKLEYPALLPNVDHSTVNFHLILEVLPILRNFYKAIVPGRKINLAFTILANRIH